jgi:hypothetical protein
MTEIKLTPISIELIHADPWEELIGRAWTNSRPNVTEFDITEVLKIDTPVAEMAGVVLHLTVPILFREIIASMRDHIMWARTSRVDNLTEVWPILDLASADEILSIDQQTKAMAYDIVNGASQDQFRQHLPLSYMTGLTVRLSIRSAIKLVGYFRHLLGTVSLEEAAKDFALKLQVVLESLGLPMRELAEVIKVPDYCPAISSCPSLPRGSRVGSIVTVSLQMPLSLRAQVIRHRTIICVDTLSTFFDALDVWSLTIAAPMTVQLSANIDTWKSIIGKRTCWLAQADLWGPIVKQVTSLLTLDEGLLPCANGRCPYAGDCVERLRGTDPGLPCPRHINLTKSWKSPEVMQRLEASDFCAELERYAISSGRPMHVWGREIRILRHEEFQED